MFETRITKMLGIKYPIIGGTMASISDADFVAAISNAGGIGILASIMYQTKDDFAVAIDRIRELSDRPFAINLNFFPAQFPVSQQEYTEIMVEKGVKIVETSGHMAPPEELCQRFKEAGMIWIHKCVGLRYALKAQNLGADIVTVVGYENGGATGRLDIGTLVLVPTIAKGVQVPVIGGGGVSDGHGFAAVLSLGAEGVIMGTRLLATQECPIHESLKQALVSATELDTMLIMRSVGTHRVWTNAAATKCAEIEATGASFEEILKIVSGDNSRRVYYEGDLDCGVVPCGQGIGQVHDIPTVKDLFDRIIAQATEVVTGLTKS
ncbi:MAG: nitronate monooxygenase [Dehalococcoidia bacterium]|nr:MAG: nitronate monooxygenase [Dehalococcoidia bacterium]